MFLRFLNFSPRVTPILTANCFIIFMKITQIQPCILWKTTPVANPLHKPARTLKHSQTPQCPRFTHIPPYLSTCQRFHRPQTPHQYHANTMSTPRPHLTRSRSSQTQQNHKSWAKECTHSGQKQRNHTPIRSRTDETCPNRKSWTKEGAIRPPKPVSCTTETQTTYPFAHDWTTICPNRKS